MAEQMPARFCSGRLLRSVLWTPRAFTGRALFALALAASTVGAQTASTPPAQQVSAKRANEMTLAGLRPGVDSVTRAIAKYKAPAFGRKGETSFGWEDTCRVEALFLDTDASGKIQTIRVGNHEKWTTADCDKLPRSPWRTSRDLAVRDSTSRVLKLYGEPDSRSPSTKEGQPLELWYYAFDWAGADVPQVMEVLCTREADGKPGKVVEITLAGPSL
jgi:hypothetical protein